MRDELFLRGKVPMTKSEVRAVVLSKLELSDDSILYDVGAGTGSVSIESSFVLSHGLVYAVEKKEEALELIRKNRERFGAENVKVTGGLAPEILRPLPPPTHVFIGGNSGSLSDILNLIFEKNNRVRVVLTAITLETLSAAMEWLRDREITAEIVQMQVSKARSIGTCHMMEGGNPIYIISFGGKEPEDEVLP